LRSDNCVGTLRRDGGRRRTTRKTHGRLVCVCLYVSLGSRCRALCRPPAALFTHSHTHSLSHTLSSRTPRTRRSKDDRRLSRPSIRTHASLGRPARRAPHAVRHTCPSESVRVSTIERASRSQPRITRPTRNVSLSQKSSVCAVAGARNTVPLLASRRAARKPAVPAARSMCASTTTERTRRRSSTSLPPAALLCPTLNSNSRPSLYRVPCLRGGRPPSSRKPISRYHLQVRPSLARPTGARLSFRPWTRGDGRVFVAGLR
jgi:hypothetical protein